eukprot:scaffold38314_cov61-Phaeocystis_antarctica.AAC.4
MGSATARSPLSFSSMPRLLMVLSALGCRLPKILHDPSTASRSSDSAATKSPLLCNSWPRLLMEASVCGCRLPSISRETSSASRTSGSASSYLPWTCSSCASVFKVSKVEIRSSEKLDAQRVAVLVLALTAAVGSVLLVAIAPPLLDTGSVGPLAGAAAGAQLLERAFILAL